jgi:hypothetical protein
MAETTTKAAKEEEAPKVERTRLISGAHEIFGVSSHVVAGALHDYGHGDTDLTVEEAKAIVDKYLKRKVKEA